MDLRLYERELAGSRVLVVEGVVDLAATPQLHDALGRLVGRPDPIDTQLAVDLDAVTVCDDAALGLLLGAAAAARTGGRELIVVCSEGPLRRRLEATRFDRAVDVRASVNGAVADDHDAVS